MARSAVSKALFIALSALVVAGSVLGISAPAQAHNYLVSSTPTAGSTLTALPPQFEITSNGPLLTLGGSTGGFAFEVRDQVGNYYGDGCVTVEGPSMTVVVAALGAPGRYTVLWQVVSADGHAVSDAYTFTWAPANGQPVSEGSTAVPNCHGTAGGEVPKPNATAPAAASQKVGLSNVLWIGGTVLALGLAIAITLFVLGRRQHD